MTALQNGDKLVRSKSNTTEGGQKQGGIRSEVQGHVGCVGYALVV